MEVSSKKSGLRSLYFLDESPDGKPFADVAWNKNARGEDDDPLPQYLKPNRPSHILLFMIAGTAALLGLLFAMKSVAALGLGMFATLAFNYWRVWKQTADWTVEGIRFPESVVEGESADLKFAVRSKSGQPLPEIEVSLQFNGSQHPLYRERYVADGSSQRQVHFALRCDRGMGDFWAKPIYLTFRDAFSMFSLSLEVDTEVSIEARPNILPLNRFPQPESGMSLNAGALQSKRPGESVSFLGLREWRTGDGIRRIDWKRSFKGRQLMVKTFESDISTDVSLILDVSSNAHSEFGGLSSIESMRDSAVSLSDHFLRRSQRVQLFAGQIHVPFGGGSGHRDFLLEQIPDLKVEFQHDFAERLKQIPGDLPPGSMVVLMLGTSSCTMEDLLEFLLAVEIRRLELFLVLFDSERFAKAVTDQAQVSRLSQATLQAFYRHMVNSQKGSLGRLVSHLPDRTLVMGPGDTLANVVEEKL